jgi:hypothetical protein
VSLYPTFAVRDAGIDSNVYNDASGPKGDFTYSLMSRLFVVAPIGNTRFIGTGFGSFVYFQTFKDEQSLNGSFEGRYEVTSPGFRPFVTAGFADRRERRGFEIDARLRQRQKTASAGLDADVTPKTALTAWVAHREIAWDRDAEYLGTLLGEQLDYTSLTFAGGVRVRATPLTTFSLTGELTQDRFDQRPIRDADKLFVGPSVDFDSSAAIAGHVKAGYLRFRPLDPIVASYDGPTAHSSVQITIGNMTRLKIEADRDVDYSYDPILPYYLESGGLVMVSQHIGGPLEAIAIGERRSVRHNRVGESSFNGREEITQTAGGGLAIQLRKELRLEVIYERRQRTSTEPGAREYERRRVYASALYGL